MRKRVFQKPVGERRGLNFLRAGARARSRSLISGSKPEGGEAACPTFATSAKRAAGRVMRRAIGILLFLPAISGPAAVDETKLPPPATQPIDFVRDIKPLFDAHCLKCHGTEKPKSGFSVASRAAVLKGGENGVAVEVGQSGRSAMIHYVAHLVEDMEMPPKGKGERLTDGPIAVLRAWIDQGLPWRDAPDAGDAARFEATPLVRWITVRGDERMFREHQWMREGWDGGLERFELNESLGAGRRLAVSGRALQDDYRITLSIEKSGLSYVRGGFERYRKYFDDSGGYYRPFGGVFRLARDLHLDKTKAWVETGGLGPWATQFKVGYEYHGTDGAKSLTSWLPTTVDGVTRTVRPVAKELDEQLHVMRANVNREWATLRLEDDFRYEFYDLRTGRATAAALAARNSSTTLQVRERSQSEQLANAFRFDKVFNDYCLVSGGYLYVHVDAEDSYEQTPVDAAGRPATGQFWNGRGLALEEQTHLFNLNLQLGPWEGFTLTGGAQTEWGRREALGRVRLDETDPDDAPNLLTNRATVSASRDRFITEERATLRYTRIPFTALYAEARLRQEEAGSNEGLAGDGSAPAEEFLLKRDVRRDGQDYRTGFNVSPWRQAALNAWYQRRRRDTDFDVRLARTGPGYPGFLRERRTDADEVGARLVLRPNSWCKTTLAYKLVATDYEVVTEAVGTTPGGRLDAGSYDASIYSINFALTPWRRLRLFTSLSVEDTHTRTADQGSAAVAVYDGQTYSALGNATYLLNEKTDVNVTYEFSRADFGQNNETAGLPLGLRYQRHGLRTGVSREISKWLRTSLEYVWYFYDEPSGGHFNDYAAHGIFATARVRWR